MEEDDPLARWRSRIETQPPAATAGKEDYTAYDNPVDRGPRRLHICGVESAAWEWLPYFDMNRVLHDAGHGTRIGLVWPYAVVVIKGRNLQGLDRHLAQEAVMEVRAFDPVRFHPVTDPSAPYIDSIDIVTETRKTMMDAEIALLAEIERRH